jgi:hypothetical protein
MEVTKHRAAAVALRDERLLVIRRLNHGRRYAVLPGGGVESNERAQDAVPASPMAMLGPELRRISTENTYEPCWIRVSDLDLENLQPASIRDLVRDLAGSLAPTGS